MSMKRQATTELNHDNWDQEDPSEHEEMGTFKTAAKDVLEKRVIKTAKRRTIGSNNEEPKKSIFSGFGGFNKSQPASFDFLSNLTKGVKTNGASSNETDTNSSSAKQTSTTGMTQGGLFSMTSSTSNNMTSKSSLFSSSGNTPPTSVFTMKPATTPNESPFKIKTNSYDTNKLNNASLPPTFGTSTKQGLFSSNTISTSPKAAVPHNIEPTNTANANENPSSPRKDNEPELAEYQLKYYRKLKGLNVSVSDWIKKHVDVTPICILSPVFKDYEDHLKVIQDEYEQDKQATKATEDKNEPSMANNYSPVAGTHANKTMFTLNATTPLTQVTGPSNPGFSFGIKSSPSTNQSSSTTPGFSFGNTATPTTSPFKSTQSSTTTPGFSFGNTSSTPTTSPSMSTNPTSNSGAAAPFSFGIGKPFSFNANVQKPAEAPEDKEEDEPPKVEYTPISEEGSVYDKKCKIFVKKDGNFVDKGVGTLYIKKIEDSEKHQLLVRANTNLGNVLLNFILSSSIPTQKMGKNNVMIVCIPTPDAKPPPTPILVRVKTSEEADELLETLNKYKA